MDNVFKSLWDIGIELIKNVNRVWEWLNTKYEIAFDLKLFKINLGSFVPIQLLGVGILTLIGFWVIKSLLPGA